VSSGSGATSAFKAFSRSEGLAEMIGSQSTSSAAGGQLQKEVRIYYDFQNETETRKQRNRNDLSR
jgi:hypothetical protein